MNLKMNQMLMEVKSKNCHPSGVFCSAEQWKMREVVSNTSDENKEREFFFKPTRKNYMVFVG